MADNALATVDTGPISAAAMAGAVLDSEAERLEAERVDREVLFADELLPGVGAEPMTLREGLAAGGTFTFVVLLLLNSLDELEAAALTVLAPEIRDTFGIGNGAITFIASASLSFLVLGALPMGWLADRYRRGPIVAAASATFGVMVFLSGLATNAFTLFLARFGVGISKSNTGPVHGSLIADTYPIGVRARLSATTLAAGTVIGVFSPLLVGGIAHVAGGDDGWRATFFILGVPVMVFAVLALKIPEPRRGQQEMQSVLGGVLDNVADEPISVEAAFARLKQIRTFKSVMVGFAALGFSLFTGGVLTNLYLDERFGLDALDRGLYGSIGGLVVAVALPLAARRADGLYRTDPVRGLRLIGMLLLPVCVLLPIQYVMPSAIAFTLVGIVPTTLLMTVFSLIGPLTQSIVPYRLRGMGAALMSIYIFFFGATLGALVSFLIVDAAGPRAARLALSIPATLVGGLLILRGASHLRHDLSLVVGELREELAEQERRRADPGELPALQVSGVDFSYGSVQVLFDVGFEVRKGEVLALLGTNGAGKSTILKVVAGLGTPSRGVVRMHGRTITFVSPERRVHMGIQLLPGGQGVFPGLSVAENLEMGAFSYRADTADRNRRVARVLDLFPDLAQRRDQLAGSMSGGQQQMLALAITLLHEPDILLIDELSLGLAPVVVQGLLEVVERLKAQGVTIVIVEQSLNVALAVADRAVFLEKGQVRFEGPAAEMRDRGDLARAVFLGREGG